MAPKSSDTLIISKDNATETQASGNDKSSVEEPVAPYKLQIVWRNVIMFAVLHIGALYGFYLCLSLQMKYQTIIWAACLHFVGGFGITCGAHRLWSHRSYKANFAYRLMLMIFNCIAVQNDIIEWSRDHRLHHKFSETDADPHNANRGLFFSHMGWLMARKHPDVKLKGKKLDISDLTSDPMLIFQRTHYVPLIVMLCFIMPSVVPAIWGESIFKAYFVAGLLRYCVTLHITWTVNSFAHTHGYRPYDKFINPAENLLSIVSTLGEGWHNYHHSFPHDYRASEWGWRGLNMSQKFIDLFAWIGWVYDRKVVPNEIILRKKERTGDKEHKYEARTDNRKPYSSSSRRVDPSSDE